MLDTIRPSVHTEFVNRLAPQKREQILGLLVEGNSLRATSRLVQVSINTVTKFLIDLGQACAEYQDGALRNLKCRKVQTDEIWSFVGYKEKNVPGDRKGEFGVGDVWTYVALDADTKLAACWMVGRRDLETATAFMRDLASRIPNRIQLTTDGQRAYVEAVESAFGADVDYVQLQKLYGPGPASEGRYSPARCVGAIPQAVTGAPEPKDISTSYIERQNLPMRMSMRRFTRLTNAFSRKVTHLEYALATHFMYYNFRRPHKTVKTTPAIASGLTSHVWSAEEVISLLRAREAN